MSRKKKSISRTKVSSLRANAVLLIFAAALAPGVATANYSCAGSVSYLGIDASGDLTFRLAGSTPIHKICNVNAQGSWGFTVGACKAAYASLLSARLSSKSITVYYGDNGLTCSTLPEWGGAPTAYFVEGPN